MVMRLPSLRGILFLVVPVIALTTGCSAARGARPGVPVPIGGFSVTSLRSAYGIQGTLHGTLVRRDEWLTVSIDSGAIRTQQADPGPIWGLRLRAGLATCTADGRWEVTSESRGVRVAPLVGISSREEILDATLRPLRDSARLDVAIPPETRMNRSWVVLTLEWPFENEFATYSLDINLPLDGSAPVATAGPSGRGTQPSMRSRCASPS